ncbi:MAG: hypothetical protein PHR06_08550, partial [Candidatus Cloacimonetes bacterium]|nr:hypothetical protein [Candidatus Cloacimonadota bacterium]
MKKVLALLMVLGCFAILSAEVGFYGSARFGWWYENSSKEMMDDENSHLDYKYFMQSNSRFGANFTHDKITGKVELGLSSSGASLRQVYGEYDMGSFKV